MSKEIYKVGGVYEYVGYYKSSSNFQWQCEGIDSIYIYYKQLTGSNIGKQGQWIKTSVAPSNNKFLWMTSEAPAKTGIKYPVGFRFSVGTEARYEVVKVNDKANTRSVMNMSGTTVGSPIDISVSDIDGYILRHIQTDWTRENCAVDRVKYATSECEPTCICDSKVLFDEGCQCHYAEWKRRKA